MHNTRENNIAKFSTGENVVSQSLLFSNTNVQHLSFIFHHSLMKAVFTLCILAMSLSTSAQTDNYVFLTDGTGFDSERAQYEPELEAAATELVNALPEDIRGDFKVYDFGFYLNNEVFAGGFEEVLQHLVNVDGRVGSSYLVFARELDERTNETSVKVLMKIPTSTTYPCVDLDRLKAITILVETAAAQETSSSNPYSTIVRNTVIAGIASAKKHLEKAIYCCKRTARNSECSLVCSFTTSEIAGTLKSLGYLEYDDVQSINIREKEYTGAFQSDYEILITNNNGHQFNITQETSEFIEDLIPYEHLGVVGGKVDHFSEEDCTEFELQFIENFGGPVPTTALYYEHMIILEKEGNLRIFFKFEMQKSISSDPVVSNQRSQAIPVLVYMVLRKAVIDASVGVVGYLVFEVVFERIFGPAKNWEEAWENTDYSVREIFIAAVEGAVDNVYTQIILGCGQGMLDYILDTSPRNFIIDDFMAELAEGCIKGLGIAFTGAILKQAFRVCNKYFKKVSITEIAQLIVPFLNDFNLVNAWKGLFDWEIFRKNTVDLETVSNYYTRTGKTADDFADELFTEQSLIRSWLDDQATNIYRFTFKQIDDYVAFATKQGNQSKVLLGMWDGGGSSSYIAKAGTDHTYFDMGSKWDEAVALVDGGVNDHLDEMWEINKKFLQNERSAGKEFWFSHDPYTPGNEQFFAREVNWLIDEGVQDFIQVGDLWKAVW